VRLPRLTFWRRGFRRLARWLLRLIVFIFIECTVTGLENIPRHGAGILVFNHLGDADPMVGMAFICRQVEFFAKTELYKLPLLGKLLDAYGVIWLHRGAPDRRALRAALDGLSEGRLVGIAPEGRESLTGSLEEGTGGAAYLAFKSRSPVVPITFTGTENARIYPNLKHFKRTRVSLTVGSPLKLASALNRHEAVHQGTQQIMYTLASLLPPEYRGVYQSPSPAQPAVFEIAEDGGQNGSQ
jgi:1-acyl-sn-glycerol-3-phosphate acyltransferase